MTRLNTPATPAAFLAALAAELRALGATGIDDEVAEIRAHLADATAGVHPDDVPAVLAEFGDPAVLARSILAERTAASSLGGVPRAGRGRIALGWALDVAWAVFLLPLTWLSAGPWFAFAVHDVAWSDLATIGTERGMDPSFAAMIGVLALVLLSGVAWAVGWTVRLVARRRAGLATIGTRAAGIVMLPGDDGAQPVAAIDAVRAGMPSIRRRGLAVTAAIVAITGLVLSAAWIPVQGRLMREDQRKFEIEQATDQATEARWQEQTTGWVSELYEEIELNEGVDAGSLMADTPDLGFAMTAEQYADFITGARTDGVTSWRFVHLPGTSREDTLPTLQVLTGDPVMTVAVTEVINDSGTLRHVVFCFAATLTETDIGTEEAWRLVGIWRDPPGRAGGRGPSAEEARNVIAGLLGLWGLPESGTMMTERFAATPDAALLLSYFQEYDPDAPEMVLDLRLVEDVRFEGEAAVVSTNEWWITREEYDRAMAEGARWLPYEDRHYEYRVIIDRGLPMVDARTRTD